MQSLVLRNRRLIAVLAQHSRVFLVMGDSATNCHAVSFRKTQILHQCYLLVLTTILDHPQLPASYKKNIKIPKKCIRIKQRTQYIFLSANLAFGWRFLLV